MELSFVDLKIALQNMSNSKEKKTQIDNFGRDMDTKNWIK